MKKILVLLLLAAMIAPAFADDAKVLPKGVLRTTLAPSLALTSKQFDDGGSREDITGVDKITVWTLSAALEYGITDAVNIAAQWGPGWQFAGTIDTPAGESKAKPTGLNDLFLGAKAQILGPNGFVANDMHRLAAAAGLIVPLSVYDAEEVVDNAAAGDEYQASRVGNDTYATGFRLYYDYIISESFFWNLYSEFIYFFPRDLEYPNTTTLPPPKTLELETEPGYELTLETEPDYSMMVGDGLELTTSMPITYKITGESTVEGTAQDDASTLLTVQPTVALFLQSIPVPTQIEFGYSIPVYGTETGATNVFLLQIKNFLRF
jgi:hypothetical protein